MRKGARNGGLILMLAVFLCAASTPWRASFSFERDSRHLTIVTRLEDHRKALTTDTGMKDNTLTVEYSHPLVGDASKIAREAPDLVSLSRLDPEGRVLRIGFKRNFDLRTVRSNGTIRYQLTVPTGEPDLPPPPVIANSVTYAAGSADRPNPVPASGVVRAEVESADKARVAISFNWAAPVGAVAFQRGDSVWVVFDAETKLNLEELTVTSRFLRNITLVKGPGFTGFRAEVEPSLLMSARGEGNMWTIVFGDKIVDVEGSLTALRQTKEGVGSRLAIVLKEATNVFWLDDPDAKDRIAVVTALPPAQGMSAERQLVDALLLETAQGFVVAPRRDDLMVSLEGGEVIVEHPTGLALSGGLIRQSQAAPERYFRDTWPGGFLKEYDSLTRNAAIEASTPRGPANARLALARFLVDHELATEATGLLSLMIAMDPTLTTEPEVRLLRGAARAMLGRLDDARLDLQMVSSDPVAALWRGYVEAKDMSWFEARREFEAGQDGLENLPREWRARMLIQLARANYELNDLGPARMAVLKALAERPSPTLQLQARLIEAKIFVAQKNTKVGRLLAILAASPNEEISARATLDQTLFLLGTGDMKSSQGVEILQGLRYRWRGDDFELEVARALGKLYMQMGDNRHGIDVMRAAWLRQPGNPVGRKLADELMGAFVHLFLEGGADELDPIQAVGMFYDFKELTPVGADGDRMIRKLAQRLVAFDLLDQAADLLQYQVDERLDIGVVKARVATDLAGVYLMARQPEKALQAIEGSRYTLLPPELNRERRVIEARALADLGRYDHALDVISNDQNTEARALRADIAWRMKDWPAAAKRLEDLLGTRWNSPENLTPDEQSLVLRLAIAYSLAGQADAIESVAKRYTALMQRTAQAIAFQTVTSKADVRGAELREAAKRIADVDTFTSFTKRMKDKFASDPAPIGAAGSAPAAPIPATTAATPAAPASAKGA